MRSLLVAIIVLLAFFQNWLLSISPVFGYIDEAISLFCLCYYLVSKKNDWGRERHFVVPFIIVFFAGFLFNYAYGIQSSHMALIEDSLSIFKFVFTYLGIKQYLCSRGINAVKIIKYVMFFVRIYLLILLAFALVNIVIPIGMDAGLRYGFRMFAFVYGTPGHLINQMTYALIFIETFGIVCKKKIWFWELAAVVVMMCTLKTRAFVLITFFYSMRFFVLGNVKVKLRYVLPVLAFLLYLIGYSQFEHYFIEDDAAPRAMFVNAAVKIVGDTFPWGTGYGTFGSSAAAKYYSPLYVACGFDNRWGMTQENPFFLNDNYFPMIFVQFGFAFALIFLFGLYRYCKCVVKENTNKFCRFIAIFYVFDILQSSLQSSYLAHFSVVTLTIVFLLCCYPNKKNGLLKYECEYDKEKLYI